ncbi:2-hydroxy-6-oxo-2,4-heptadienoate hydrolase [Bhargavaea cecembensis]|uniref:2-hydroxy-6-oxo-2,4-heptadienoate hydrolase n=2 Tax=Bhargavaea cecembensis TaxID=394098 RepID=A0A161SJV1_9BACL|nr:2-hydroxy-6-oxo-2,4-heptadienoate hydrolase [Bhargavaea cecembensis]
MKVNGIETNYLKAGSGTETMILIHGSGPGVSAYANWRLVIPRLSESLHVFAPDVVGFGKTGKLEKDQYSLDNWVNHLIGFIEEVADGPVYLVGNSFGGAMALHIAHRRPDLVKKLILMGSVGVKHKLSYGLSKVWGYDPSIENMRHLIELFSYDEAAAKNEELVRLRYEASMEPETKEAFHAMFYENQQQRVDELALSDEDLKNIKTETLLFHGLNDQVILFEDTSYKLVQLLPHAELHLFNECGHWTQIEKTDPFINHILAFVNGK